MQNLRPSNIKVIFRRPSCGSPVAVASGFIAGTAPVTEKERATAVSVEPETCRGRSGARFTKYLTTILRLSYDNAVVTIDLRRTTNLPNRLTKGARLFLGMVHLQTCKIV